MATSRKRTKTRATRTKANSPQNSILTHNNDPKKLSNFKKRIFSTEKESKSKLIKVANVSKDRTTDKNNVLVPLDRIVHERCYNQYLFPNKTLWKYLNSVHYKTPNKLHPPKIKKRKKRINRNKIKRIAVDEKIDENDTGFLNITTQKNIEPGSEDDSEPPAIMTTQLDSLTDTIQQYLDTISKTKLPKEKREAELGIISFRGGLSQKVKQLRSKLPMQSGIVARKNKDLSDIKLSIQDSKDAKNDSQYDSYKDQKESNDEKTSRTSRFKSEEQGKKLSVERDLKYTKTFKSKISQNLGELKEKRHKSAERPTYNLIYINDNEKALNKIYTFQNYTKTITHIHESQKHIEILEEEKDGKDANGGNVGYALIKDLNDLSDKQDSKEEDMDNLNYQNIEESKDHDHGDLKRQNDEVKDQNDDELKDMNDNDSKFQNDESLKEQEISSSIDFEKKFLLKDHSRPLDKLSSPKIESIPNESLLNQNRSQFEIETIEFDSIQVLWKQTPLYHIAQESGSGNEIIEKSLDLK